MKSDISIIIPAYNAASYIEECINSVISQTKKELEIIVINDGSTDNTLKILEKFKDKRIKLITTKNNGIGKTRNLGLKNAKSEYVFFLDSDDYISKNAMEVLYEKIIKEKADIVIGNMLRLKDDNNLVKDDIDFPEGSLKDNKTQLFKIPLGPCCKLFRRSILDVNFSEVYKYEDVPFTANAIKKSSKTVKCNEYIYYYRIHDNSETTSMDKRVFDILEVLKQTNDMYKKQDVYDELEYLNIQLLSRYNLQQKNQKDKKMANEFLNASFNHLNKYFPNWKKNKYLKKRNILKRIIETHKSLIKLYWHI